MLTDITPGNSHARERELMQVAQYAAVGYAAAAIAMDDEEDEASKTLVVMSPFEPDWWLEIIPLSVAENPEHFVSINATAHGFELAARQHLGLRVDCDSRYERAAMRAHLLVLERPMDALIEEFDTARELATELIARHGLPRTVPVPPTGSAYAMDSSVVKQFLQTGRMSLFQIETTLNDRDVALASGALH